MKEILIDTCTLFGGTILILFAIGLVIAITYGTYDKAYVLICKYKIKHRFKKKPIAKCYCVDCLNYTKSTQYCAEHLKHFVDDHFCSYAEPRRFEEE